MSALASLSRARHAALAYLVASLLLCLPLEAQPSSTATSTALIVNKNTGAITGPVSAAIFASANSLGGGGGGSTAWGGITGTLGDQADLSTALGLRVLATTLATYFANPAVHASFAPAAWRAALDLEPSVDYQPYSSNLTPFATNGGAYYLSRTNHSGTQSADTITDGSTNKAYTAAEKTKLAGIASGATANSSDATLLARANHTGTQAISTITGLQAALDAGATFAALVAVNASGVNTDGLVDWSQLVNVPSGFADGSDDGTGGSGISDGDKGDIVVSGSGTGMNLDSGVVTNAKVAADAAIALSKLATDPLARANHTGTQPMSTISDAGNSATRAVGTTPGTVAAGDDSRITGAVQSTRTISTTSPLNGGGDMSANRTLGIDNATTSTKGAASFNSSHFSVTDGAVSLANSGVTAGTHGNSTHTPVIQVDALGRIVVISNTATSGSGGMGGDFSVAGGTITSSAGVRIESSSNNNIVLAPHGTGELRVVGSANITGNLAVGGTMNLTTVNADTFNVTTSFTGPVFDTIIANGTNVTSNSTGNFTISANGFKLTGNNTTKSADFDLSVIPAATMSSTVIDVTKTSQVRTLTANETWTVSATPADETWFNVKVRSPSTGYTGTLPAGTWKAIGSDGTLTTITAVAVPADGLVDLTVRYDTDTTTYYVYGYPYSAGGGSGTVDTSGSPSAGQAAQFSDSNTITGVGVVGTGNYVKDTAPTISAASLTGVVTRNGATILTPTTMGASVIDTSGVNQKTTSGNLTLTFSGAPSANTIFIATLENSSGSALTHTIPSSIPWGEDDAVTSVQHPANSKIRLIWEYTGSVYLLTVVTAAPASLHAIATSGSASDLGSGTIPDARFPSTLPALNGGALTSLNAGNLGSGTIPDARFPSTLPAANGGALTSLNASNLGSGTIPDARFPATLPAANGGALTSLNASNLGSGTIPDARFPATLPATNGSAVTALNGSNISTGTVADARIDAAVARDSEVAAAYVPLTGVGQKQEWVVPLGDETTTITTGTKVTFRAPYACTVTAVRASLTTQSSSGIPTFDINEGGTSILSTKLTIDSGEKTSTSAAAAAVISDTTLADDAEITIDIDTAGTGAAGAKVTIYVTRS